MNFDRGLAVGRGRKRLRLLGRNRRVAGDHRRGNAAQRLNRQRQRSDVQQEQVFHFALEYAALDARTDRDHFVRVDALVAFTSEELFYERLNARHARLSADQHHFVDLAGVNARVFHALLARTNRALNDVLDHAFELCTGQLLYQVLRSARVGSDEWKINLCLHRGRKLDLGALGRVTQTLQCHLVALAAQVEAFVFLEFVDEPIHQALVDVVAAEVSVTVRGLNFDHTFADFENRNIESAAAEIVYGNGFVLAFIQAVGEGRRSGLVDDALYFEAGDLPSIFRGLPLRVIEVRGNGDDRFRDFLAEVVFRSFLQLLQNQC